jgi:glutathione S-transferase
MLGDPPDHHAMTAPASPVLYTFRRCPYAMRARLALRASGLAYEHREIELKHKPEHLLTLSPKGTVPVLWLPAQAQVIDQSLDIMLWALQQHDPQQWLPTDANVLKHWLAQIERNDGDFKHHLDRCKYPQRFGLSDGLAHRAAGARHLLQLNAVLVHQAFLSGTHWGLLDAAQAPFVRQFAHTDPLWFAAQPWPRLAAWLAAFEASADFAAIMAKHPLWAPV